jgi:Type II secretion system (T2SS), protein E, N-terminal domain
VSPTRQRLRLGELLVDKGVVSPDQIRIALTEQKKRKEHLGKILVKLGFATEAIIRDVLGGTFGQESVDLSKIVVDSEAVKLIPKEMARRYHLLPLTYEITRHCLTVAMADTFNV